MADYNENELSRMRQEAIRRMQEMQRRAQGIFGGTGQSSPEREHTHAQDSADNEQGDNGRADHGQPRPSGKSLLGANGELFRLAGIPIDEEKALIGMLIYILYKQGADIKLLLALGYLLI